MGDLAMNEDFSSNLDCNLNTYNDSYTPSIN